jgi:hypothetical protein
MSFTKSVPLVRKHTKMAFVAESPDGFAKTCLLRYREPRGLVDAYVRHAHAGTIPGCLHIPMWMTRHEIHIDVTHPKAVEIKATFMQRRKQREDKRAAEIAAVSAQVIDLPKTETRSRPKSLVPAYGIQNL